MFRKIIATIVLPFYLSGCFLLGGGILRIIMLADIHPSLTKIASYIAFPDIQVNLTGDEQIDAFLMKAVKYTGAMLAGTSLLEAASKDLLLVAEKSLGIRDITREVEKITQGLPLSELSLENAGKLAALAIANEAADMVKVNSLIQMGRDITEVIPVFTDFRNSSKIIQKEGEDLIENAGLMTKITALTELEQIKEKVKDVKVISRNADDTIRQLEVIAGVFKTFEGIKR
jgi:hypothetical protein